MNAAAAKQPPDLRIPSRRPLLPVKAAMVFLDRNEDDVLALIERGKLVAFDVARPGRRMYPLVWRGSAVDYKNSVGGATATPCQAVIDDILPQRDLRAVEVRNLFSVNQGHIANLIADGLLTVDASRPVVPGRGQSPWIKRSSVAEFLRKRRIT